MLSSETLCLTMDAGLITTFHPFLNIDRSPDLERLFRDSAADLAGFFVRRNEGKEQADDLVQETFLRMAEVLEKGKRPDNLRAYLFGIARHVSQAAWRRFSREPEVADAVEVEKIAAAHPRDDRVDAAGEMIEQLPALQREILDLRFYHSLSYAEMAEALDVPIGTVRSRLHNAISLIRKRIEEDEADHPEELFISVFTLNGFLYYELRITGSPRAGSKLWRTVTRGGGVARCVSRTASGSHARSREDRGFSVHHQGSSNSSIRPIQRATVQRGGSRAGGSGGGQEFQNFATTEFPEGGASSSRSSGCCDGGCSGWLYGWQSRRRESGNWSSRWRRFR